MLFSGVIGYPVGELRVIPAPTKKKEEDLTNPMDLKWQVNKYNDVLSSAEIWRQCEQQRQEWSE